MNIKLKIGILSGILILLLLIAAGTYMQITKPADTLEDQVVQLARYERSLLYTRGTIYRYSTELLHIPADVIDSLHEHEPILSAVEQETAQYRQTDAALRTSLSAYLSSSQTITRRFTELIADYNQLGAAQPKPFDAAKIAALETLVTTHINDFRTLRANLRAAAAQYRKRAAILSGILITVTWILGLFITWALMRTLYTILLNSTAKKRIVLKVSPKLEGSVYGHAAASELGTDAGAYTEESFTAQHFTPRSIQPESADTRTASIHGSSQPGSLSVFSSQNARQSAAAGSSSAFQSQYGNRTAPTYAELAEQNKQLTEQLSVLESRAAELEKAHNTVQTAYTALQHTAEKKAEEYRKSAAQLKESLTAIQTTAEQHQNDSAAAQKLVESFKTGQQLFRTTHEHIQFIIQHVSQIQEMSEVMENVAEQAKMLSMNAAIEAAHAGDAGKGFAVVAEELGRLAAAALESSKDIGGTIKQIVAVITRIGSTGDELDRSFESIHLQTDAISASLADFSAKMAETGSQTRSALHYYTGGI